MLHHKYAESDSYPIAILIKSASFNKEQLNQYYARPLMDMGIAKEDIIFLPVAYNDKNKAPNSLILSHLMSLLSTMDSIGVKTILCCDANYFKVLTKQRKADPNIGYILPCAVQDYMHMEITLGVNYSSFIYNEVANKQKLKLALTTLSKYIKGDHIEPGTEIIKSAHYPVTNEAIQTALNALYQYPYLSCDLETASLDFDKAGIGTVTFCWSDGEGIAFPVDYTPFSHPMLNAGQQGDTGVMRYGYMKANPTVRAMLKSFLQQYKGRLRYHNATYDIKILIYELFMDSLLDQDGLLIGLECLGNNFDDTKLVKYLATNFVGEKNELGLKASAHEFAGNWAESDINDITRIPMDKLLKYNLIDGLSTNWLYDKHYPKLVKDAQEALYHGLFLKTQKLLVQMELTGMPLNLDKVQSARETLESIVKQNQDVIDNSAHIAQAQEIRRISAHKKDFKDRQDKAKNPDNIKEKDLDTYSIDCFNPNSGKQKATLLYDLLELPVLGRTDTGLPETTNSTLKALVNHTDSPEVKELLNALEGFGKANKILTTFIPAFEKAVVKEDGSAWLHGSFNLGGTISGRLSSSSPNLTNLPSGSKYGKLIKECFAPAPGMLFVGSDFDSLEDKVNALITRDPNKLKVYLDGYDGHSLRAASYFPELMPDITETVESINSIKRKYDHLRSESKAATFALTYAGTWSTLVNNLGWSQEKAKRVEANYHKLYSVSDEWVESKLVESSSSGFVVGCFGLRLRCPLLARTISGHRTTPLQAQAEGRSAGNMVSGQSYGQLTNRAAVEFMEKVWASPYRTNILPVAMIHDAIYLVIQEDINVIKFVNDELIASMAWQELPEIRHETIKLSSKLDLFWPSWANALEIPNDASTDEIAQLCKNHAREVE